MMTQERKPKSTIERTGITVYERFNIQIEVPEDEKGRFNQDPIVYIRQFLEEQGFTVNELRMQGRGDISIERMPRCEWYHEVYPHQSIWICVS